MASSNFFLSGCSKQECEFWLEGNDCETEVKQKYFGTYNGIAKENDFTPIFLSDRFDVDVTVSNYPDNPKRLYFEDWAFGQYYVILTSDQNFTVPLQALEIDTSSNNIFESMEFEGYGRFNDESQMSYTIEAHIATGFGSSGTEVFEYSGTK